MVNVAVEVKGRVKVEVEVNVKQITPPRHFRNRRHPPFIDTPSLNTYAVGCDPLRQRVSIHLEPRVVTNGSGTTSRLGATLNIRPVQ
jgi:hypothetical protein